MVLAVRSPQWQRLRLPACPTSLPTHPRPFAFVDATLCKAAIAASASSAIVASRRSRFGKTSGYPQRPLGRSVLWRAFARGFRSTCGAATAADASQGSADAQEEQEEKPAGQEDLTRLPFGLSTRECPRRLEYVPKELVDDHTQIFYAMVNDIDRNDFYWNALKSCDLQGKLVLDIGSGSGLLAMMAAKLGARRVVAIDENPDMARLARHNVAANGFSDIIEVRHGLSTEMTLEEKADVLVTETMGTWMTCEGMVQWCEDARQRLLKEHAQIVPQRGTQYAVLIESQELARLFSCRERYRGLDLSAVMELQDTASCLWSKRVGIKPSDLVYSELCEPFPLLDVDFTSTVFRDLPSVLDSRVQVRGGRVDAVLDFWVCEDAQGRQLSTDPRARRCEPWAYARDLAWGNGLQLVGEEPEEDLENDPRWLCFPERDALPGAGPVMDARNLRLCKCACVYYGYGGFVICGDQAQFRQQGLQELADEQNHVEAQGCTLYVARGGDNGTWGESEPRVPMPFDVDDEEQVVVATSFQSEQRGAQHRLLRARR